jgi:CRP/FNR family transcriptional regulator, cyclic AMP receptor protein
VILDGRAEARRGGALLRSLGAGDFFGEIGLIDRSPRTATVTSTSPMRCFVVASHEFRAVLGENANIAVRILDGVTQRLRRMLPPDEGSD